MSELTVALPPILCRDCEGSGQDWDFVEWYERPPERCSTCDGMGWYGRRFNHNRKALEEQQ